MQSTSNFRANTPVRKETEPVAPQFDETAIAIAQPVQPLTHRRKRVSSTLRWIILSITLVGILITGIVVAAVTLVGMHNTSSEAGASSDTQSSSPPSQTQPLVEVNNLPPQAVADNEESRPAPVTRRTVAVRRRQVVSETRTNLRVAPLTAGDESRPVARRVGVIYGRVNHP